MSTPLAIAAVTTVLKDLLNDGLINSNLTADVKVTARPPVREPGAGTAAQSQLNLFLYRVTPNNGWRNADLPARNADGARVANPPLALDLHYLLTVYDERDLHAEILLGYAMNVLHGQPGLAREAIRRSLQRNVSDTGLPVSLRALTHCGLADQLESIKITPSYLDPEEMSKLWTGFMAPYRPSMAYLVSVVLIQATEPVRSVLPVLKMGPDARGPVAQASLRPPLPTLLAAAVAGYHPAARLGVPGNASQRGDAVHLLGHHLRGTQLKLTLTHQRLGLKLNVAESDLDLASPPKSADRLRGTEALDLAEAVTLLADTRVIFHPDDATPADAWAAGVYAAELEVQLPGEAAVRTSNAIPWALAPRIRFDGAHAPQVSTTAGTTTIRIRCVPSVRPGQRVSLAVGSEELAGSPVLTAPATVSDTLEFTGKLPAGMRGAQHLARLRVDGIESLFIQRWAPPAPPAFDASQQIAIP